MSFPKALVMLAVGAVAAVAVLHFSLNRYTQARLTAGCPALNTTGELDTADTVAFWDNLPERPLLTSASTLSEDEIRVLGATIGDDKWIEIDLSDQRLRAWEGDTMFLESLISSGLWNKTPVGEYRIWYKIQYTKMEGGIKGTRSYYYLPNVPFAMFFYGSYGLHGTYWHNNFGNRMSHGCVNAPTTVAEKLFYWSNPQLPAGKRWVRASADNPGTKVVVHD